MSFLCGAHQTRGNRLSALRPRRTKRRSAARREAVYSEKNYARRSDSARTALDRLYYCVDGRDACQINDRWGLGGFCPGPSLANLGALRIEALIFVPTMALGMLMAQRFFGADR